MARWSDLSKLRMEMDMLQAKARNLHDRGKTPREIADSLEIPEKSARVIVAYLGGRFNGS